MNSSPNATSLKSEVVFAINPDLIDLVCGSKLIILIPLISNSSPSSPLILIIIYSKSTPSDRRISFIGMLLFIPPLSNHL